VAQQRVVSAAAIELALATQRVTRGNERVAEVKALAEEASKEADDQAALVTLAGSPAITVNGGIVVNRIAAVDAAFVNLRAKLFDDNIVEAERLQRQLENLRRRYAHDYDELARHALNQLTPARITSTPNVVAAQGDYEA